MRPRKPNMDKGLGASTDTRFRKGTSGNPKGRPKRSSTPKPIEKVLERNVTAVVDGARRSVPVMEAVGLQLAQRALAGDMAAMRELIKIVNQAVARQQEEVRAVEPLEVKVIFVACDEPSLALDILDIVYGSTDKRTRLRNWVVQAALDRLPGSPLCDEDAEAISAFCEDPAALVWPGNRVQ